LLYSAILGLTLLFFGAALYLVQSQYTFNSLKQDLMVSGQNLGRNLLWRALHPPPARREPQDQLPPPLESLSSEQAFQDLREREIVRILDPNGSLVASPLSGEQEALPLSQEGLRALVQNQVWWQVSESGGERILIFNQPVSLEGQVVFIIQVARTLTERDRTLTALGRFLLAASLLVILAAFGIGWIFAGIMLKPIHKITQTAQEIGSKSDFSRRVDYNGPKDEVGNLATTFNSMLSRLQDAYRRVSESLKMQRNFVADVSHELRTPLTTVRGNLELLRHQPPLPAEEQADILTDVVEESDRLIRLVNELLVLARADTGSSLGSTPVNLREVIEDSVRQVRWLEPGREIIETLVDFSVLGDRDAIKQILLAILDNALKYSSGPIKITVEKLETEAVIGIHDQGLGIPPEVLEHVFDRFYRGDAAQGKPGFGLGLPITRALVEGQGGKISIESDPGKGSIIWVYLPLASEQL
jgi:two-component system, OmpR family, sensor kinase